MSSARREGSAYHFKNLWYASAGARTNDLPVVRQALYTGPSNRFNLMVLDVNSMMIFIKSKMLLANSIIFYQIHDFELFRPPYPRQFLLTVLDALRRHSYEAA